jgi:cofilin
MMANIHDIITKQTSAKDDYEEFLSELPENDCRWAVYDFKYELPEGGKRTKILFVSWTPDIAPVRKRMVFASSKSALTRSLVGVAAEVQATDLDDLNYEASEYCSYSVSPHSIFCFYRDVR